MRTLQPRPSQGLVCLLAALAACSGPRPAGLSDLERETRLAEGVRPERASSRVRALCALGPRMGGTGSGAAASQFLALAFADMGLDVRIERDPPRRAHAELDWQVWATGADGERHELASAWPYGFSPSAAGEAELTLEPRGGGALLSEDALRRTPADAPVVVLVDGAVTLDGSYPVVQHLRTRGSDPVPHFGLSRADGAWLRARLAAGGSVRIGFRLAALIEEAEVTSVVARLPARQAGGAAWTADHFLFCAHGDSDAGGPGADDNASGIASVLEIAAAWSDAIQGGLVDAPVHEVRFAVWGSEIHSSRAYLERRDEHNGRLLGVLNFDQSGFGSSADRVFIEPDDLPANRALAEILFSVLRDHAPGGTPASEPGEFPREWASVRSLGGTDSYVFSESEGFIAGGLPALTVYSSAWGQPVEHARTPGMPGESWSEREVVAVDHDVYYHSAGDTPANTTDLEPWNMAWCSRVALLGVRRYLATVQDDR